MRLGIDIGAHEIMVCAPGPDSTQVVRAFGTYTVDSYAIADWLQLYGIRTVAMESTGVYWIPLFETLEARGLQLQAWRRQVRQKFVSVQGQSLRSKRGVEVETVFGRFNEDRGFRRFLLRGLAKVKTEWRLLWKAHNLAKLAVQ